MTGLRHGARARRWTMFIAALAAGAVLASLLQRPWVASAQSTGAGWQIGDDALDLKNPVAVSPAVASKGADLYRAKCQRCHGRSGRGNGPDADIDNPPRDLTDGSRAGRNPDGVLFYKIWNGRTKPRMPAFKTDVSREDVWTIVHYIKTLRVP